MFKKREHKKGISLVEVVIGASIVSLALVGLVTAYNLYLGIALKDTAIIQANFLLEEGLEAVRAIRDDDWTNNIISLTSGVEYGLEFQGGSWQSTTTISLLDSVFYRTFSVEDVLRDSNDDISSSGTNDPDIKKINLTVSWLEGNSTTTKSISTYLTNLF